MLRAAKAVALLELIQETTPTDAELVAQCLYDRMDRGNNVAAVTEALEDLRRKNLLGYSEKHGYKLQSSCRRGVGARAPRHRRARETIGEMVQASAALLGGRAGAPRLQARSVPVGRPLLGRTPADDVTLVTPATTPPCASTSATSCARSATRPPG
jgi:hypothetical protein